MIYHVKNAAKNGVNSMQHCPCGTDKTYQDCCGIYISGQRNPATPEELMRSRYTAYHQANIGYITDTMQSPAADNFDAKAALEWTKKINWIGLDIIQSTQDSNRGVVEFRAHYALDNKKYILHEISTFKCENGKWYYVDGTEPNRQTIVGSAKKIGRNDKCPCGSNKKSKKCCGASP